MNPFRFLLAASAVVACAATGFAESVARTEIPNAMQPQLATAANGSVWLVYSRVHTAPTPAAPASDPHAADHGHGGHGNTADKSAAPVKKVEGSKGGGKSHGKGHGGPRPAGDVFVARSTDGGATFGPAVKVATVQNLMVGNRRGPRLVAHGDRLTLTVIGHELISFHSIDGGKTWSQPVTINEVPASAHEGLHDLAASPGGELFVTWLDARSGKMELWSATSKDGGRSWARNELVYRSPDKSICECCHPSAVFDADGNLAVMWRNSIQGERDMWLMTRPSGAKQFTAARKLGVGTWKINACPHDGGEVVALGDGKFGAVWQREGAVFAIQSQGAEVRLGAGKQPVAVGGKTGMVVVWQDGTELKSVRDLNATPTKHATDARFPAVAALPAGKGALLAYETGPTRGGNVVIERL